MRLLALVHARPLSGLRCDWLEPERPGQVQLVTPSYPTSASGYDYNPHGAPCFPYAPGVSGEIGPRRIEGLHCFKTRRNISAIMYPAQKFNPTFFCELLIEACNDML